MSGGDVDVGRFHCPSRPRSRRCRRRSSIPHGSRRGLPCSGRSEEFPGNSTAVVFPCVTSVLPFPNVIVRSVQPGPHPLMTSTVRSTCPSPATFPAPQTVSGAQPLSTKMARKGAVVSAAAGAASANAAAKELHASASLNSFIAILPRRRCHACDRTPGRSRNAPKRPSRATTASVSKVLRPAPSSARPGSAMRRGSEWPREESNLRAQVRSLPLYPLSYGA